MVARYLSNKMDVIQKIERFGEGKKQASPANKLAGKGKAWGQVDTTIIAARSMPIRCPIESWRGARITSSAM
jgi:hypothetical protein